MTLFLEQFMQPIRQKLPCDKTVVELSKETAYFMYYRSGSLYYKTDSGFVIQIPTSELVSSAPYRNEERGLALLRWLRPQYGVALKELNPSSTVLPTTTCGFPYGGDGLFVATCGARFLTDAERNSHYNEHHSGEPAKLETPDGFKHEHSIFD